MNIDRKKAYFMRVAEETALLSHAVKLKVGAVAVRDNRIICTGYNGTGPGEDNCCELNLLASGMPNIKAEDHDVMKPLWWLKTKDNVTHAEKNLIDFAARKGIALEGAELFVTHSPCMACARSIANVGFTHVYYKTKFSHLEGLAYLEEARGVTVIALA
jgi:dCMP deaminase